MNSGPPDRDQILEKMQAAIRQLGSPPGRAAFENEPWKVTPAQVKRYWPTHSRLVAEAGSSPNEREAPIDEGDLFREFARVCRDCAHIPTLAELRIKTRELGTRTHTVSSRFGGLAAFNERFRQWLSSMPEDYSDILAFEGWGRTPFGRARRTVNVRSTRAHTSDPFLPVGLTELPELAFNRLPQASHPGNSPSVLFERGVADAFRALGFQVRGLGQGKGRTADCLAMARPERFAVVIDAKARADGFVLGTEDRKFIEYARLHSEELRREGVERVYLCVVSCRFRDKDVEILRRALTATGLHGWSLWSAEALVSVVANSIRQRCDFRLGDLETRFATNGVAT